MTEEFQAVPPEYPPERSKVDKGNEEDAIPIRKADNISIANQNNGLRFLYWLLSGFFPIIGIYTLGKIYWRPAGQTTSGFLMWSAEPNERATNAVELLVLLQFAHGFIGFWFLYPSKSDNDTKVATGCTIILVWVILFIIACYLGQYAVMQITGIWL